MELIKIDVDPGRNSTLMGIEDCRAILAMYPQYYGRVGFYPPWIGYFVRQGDKVVGCGGFKGKPRDGKVEISYHTFKDFEGKGVGTAICSLLVALSVETDPSVRITARTLPEDSASTTILKRNGFRFIGIVYDEEDGDVWEWEYQHGRTGQK